MIRPNIDLIEENRLKLQQQLDAVKTQTERNKLGQFATPTLLATDILSYAKTLLPESQPIRFLDPAFGTGAFYSALLRSFPRSQITAAYGYEIDPHYGNDALQFWRDEFLDLKLADFTQAKPPLLDQDKINLLVCNPPYVRHHHLQPGEKLRLQALIKLKTGLKLSGLAGLYCYFLLLSHAWLAKGGLAAWLIPSEFMDVNYGKQVKQYLLGHITLLRIHRFNPNDTQFEDALVSSTIVWLKNEPPKTNHEVVFSYGGALAEPEVSSHMPVAILSREAKWTKFPKESGTSSKPDSNTNGPQLKLSDLFHVKRGLVTGANKFFILTPEQVSEYRLPKEFLRPILPSPRYLETNEIKADGCGLPLIKQQLFLLDCKVSENEVRIKYPSLWQYLQTGLLKGIHERYLCRHRSPWYAQESRPAAPILCTYMGRLTANNKKPFRFILNDSQATAPNVYLMLYPKPILKKEGGDKPLLLKSIWRALNNILPNRLIGEGRLYGGGLYKIEPNELANTPINEIADNFPDLPFVTGKQLSLFEL